MQIFIARKLFCIANHFAFALEQVAQLAKLLLIEAFIEGDLQSLYCVFISFDLMLYVWNEFQLFARNKKSCLACESEQIYVKCVCEFISFDFGIMICFDVQIQDDHRSQSQNIYNYLEAEILKEKIEKLGALHKSWEMVFLAKFLSSVIFIFTFSQLNFYCSEA